MLTVGERLSIARNRAGMKAQEMAMLLGRHRNRVTAYEGSAEPPLWVVNAYAANLPNDTTVAWLTAEVGPAPRDLRVLVDTPGWVYDLAQLSFFANDTNEPVIDLRAIPHADTLHNATAS